MNNVKTRFVIAISQKLSAAPDTEAKADLVEELSENLCGRYEDLVAGGMEPEEAYRAALEKLGDVDELLAGLDGGGARSSGGGQADPSDWFGSLGSLFRRTMDQAVDAASDAADLVRQAAASWGGGSSRHAPAGEDAELVVPSAELRGVSVSFPGDLTVCLDEDPDAPVRLDGDTAELSAVTSPNGVLTVTQNRAAGGSVLFARGLTEDSIQLTLPRRHWETLALATASGDIELRGGALAADTVALKTASGGMELEGLTVRRLDLNTASGDVSLCGCACQELVFLSASGDLDGEEVTAAAQVRTASGDVSLSGALRALKADTASGDIDLDTTLLPDALDLSSKSGDCSARVPEGGGFTFSLHTVSGELDSDFPFTGARHSAEGTCGDGGEGRSFRLSSVSGDVELRAR